MLTPNHSHAFFVVVSSFLNLKRIAKLDRQIARVNEPLKRIYTENMYLKASLHVNFRG
jgi:hypothetical protein